jgi:hypothetical protein
MDVIQRVTQAVGEIPAGSRLGLLIIGVGIIADLIVHLDPALDHDHGAMTAPEVSGHVVVFLGMVLVLTGVVIDGVRSSRRVRGVVIQGRHRDALR